MTCWKFCKEKHENKMLPCSFLHWNLGTCDTTLTQTCCNMSTNSLHHETNGKNAQESWPYNHMSPRRLKKSPIWACMFIAAVNSLKTAATKGLATSCSLSWLGQTCPTATHRGLKWKSHGDATACFDQHDMADDSMSCLTSNSQCASKPSMWNVNVACASLSN